MGCARIGCMQANPTRIVFMGSPDFAVPALNRLSTGYQVVGVVTQPDRPGGRGRNLLPPAVKVAALDLDLPVLQPEKIRQPQAFEQLNAWSPDLIVVAAFGQILRQEVLDLPRFGCLNIHASLLPRWRGAAPIQACLLAGDAETGVTIMKLDAGVDTGPLLGRRSMPIGPEDTAGSLSEKLSILGADLMMQVLPAYMGGKLLPQPQEDSQATYAPMLRKTDGLLDFSQPANLLVRRVRAFNPWPGAFTTHQNAILKVHAAHAEAGSGDPGKHQVFNGKPAIITGQGWLVLDEVQPAGKKPMSGQAFLAGARDWQVD